MELGDALSLLFALVYSFLIVATGICAKKVSPLAMSFYQYLTAGGLSLITMLILGEMPQAYPLVGVGAMAYLMIVNTVGAVYPAEYRPEIYLRYPFGGAAFHGIGDWVFLRRGAVWRSLYHARADRGIDCVWRGAAFGAELEGNI